MKTLMLDLLLGPLSILLGRTRDEPTFADSITICTLVVSNLLVLAVALSVRKKCLLRDALDVLLLLLYGVWFLTGFAVIAERIGIV